MHGFNTKKNSININPDQPALQLTLKIYPTVGLSITPETQLRIWDENGIMFNTAGGSWFVPLDGMITYRLSREFLFAIGVSKQLVNTYKQYNWSIYGKAFIYFVSRQVQSIGLKLDHSIPYLKRFSNEIECTH